MPAPSDSKILVGPAGWSYPDWEGIVYPQIKPRGFHRAAYLAQFFDTIEINTSFYNPLRPEVVRSWVERIRSNPSFKFSAKLWKRFTHERNANLADESVFKKGLEPLVVSGRLGALLLQFPWSFKNTRENHEYLSGLFVQFMEYPLVVEVRHGSWNEPQIFAWLHEQGVGFCNIDQPLLGKSIQPSQHLTTPVGYVRLHGRNYEAWFTSSDRPSERYNYLYTIDELKPWAERIANLARAAETVFVITNNHYQGKAVANALELTSMLRGQPVPAPENLGVHYPELAAMTSRSSVLPVPSQGDFSFDGPIPAKR